MEPFATNLRRRAEQLGITHAEVARRSGLTERRYGNYVSGLREPDLQTLVRIASTLDVTIDELVGAGLAGRAGTTEELFQERISAALKALSSNELRTLLTMIEALAATRTSKGGLRHANEVPE
ncbi:helix-turn-helix transcriptional regulator [Neorhizobium sp. T786]|uniref:helix-turn-helix domain-containing protein n=1 Tax=Pseudorhizobium xiangyangii TaxID=2883104 RepID=UPI001CFF5B11|nr:helix-turn-helix transcriptional regulator [Neorhizobium xiangyangii]MCB5202613.1 helix-turn-helix transcriptional regulator [Neorhizobium xiangyangii]